MYRLWTTSMLTKTAGECFADAEIAQFLSNLRHFFMQAICPWQLSRLCEGVPKGRFDTKTADLYIKIAQIRIIIFKLVYNEEKYAIFRIKDGFAVASTSLDRFFDDFGPAAHRAS